MSVWPEGFETEGGSGAHAYKSVPQSPQQREVARSIGLVESTPALAAGAVSNDEFIAAIFGDSFRDAYPLVCSKSGDPDDSGWAPRRWPCDTSDSGKNWYVLPSLYVPDETGRFRARKEQSVSVHAVMVDDVGTKVSAKGFSNAPPSWAVETSPGNYQFGYILETPLTDLGVADKLKEVLIAAGFCDPGASGGTSRWMRLPNAINGRPKYGDPSPKCRLAQWRPHLKYTVDSLYSLLNLQAASKPSAGLQTQRPAPGLNAAFTPTWAAEEVLGALEEAGLYKKPLGNGKHDVTCPWFKEHTDETDNGAAYFEPSEHYPTGGFKCHHSHGEFLSIRDLIGHLQIGSKEPEGDVSEAAAEYAPQKLPAALKPVLALDLDWLPEAMRDAVADISDRLQCPADYLTVAMLSATGAVIGNRVGIFPLENDESWEVYPALWGGIVGDPGTKKTPALQQAHKPLQHLDSEAAKTYALEKQAHKQAMQQHEQALQAWNKNPSGGIKPIAPAEPKRTRYLVHDTTYQALGVILSDNPRGVLALADELSGLLQSLDTAGQEAARGFYLSGWGGSGGYSFDRISREAVSLDRYCLSVFGGFQPDKIKAYVQFSQRGSSKNDGLLQRFQLLVWPNHPTSISYIDRPADKAAIEKYFKAVVSLADAAYRPNAGATALPNGSHLLHFSPAAQKAFSTWFIKNENMISKGGLDSARQSHFAKYRSLIPALALLFHLIDGHSGPVCDKCLIRAVSYARYLKSHADRIYASVSGHDLASVRTLAARLLKKQIKDGFTCRTLTLKGWSGLTSRETAQAAIDALVDYGWLSEIEVRTGGRPSIKYFLNAGASEDLL